MSRALHDAPDILPLVRLYSIGSWNTAQDPHSRRHLREVHAPSAALVHDRRAATAPEFAGLLNLTFPLARPRAGFFRRAV